MTASEHSSPHVRVPLYWSLPGPTAFLARLADAFDANSALVVRLASADLTGTRQIVHDALRHACHEPERIQFLDIHEGSHLESDIGHHLERPTLTATQLANWSTPPRTTVVLTPHSQRARARCRSYFEEFVAELTAVGPTCSRLVLAWSDEDDPLTLGSSSELRFDGRLSEDEMHAYVTLRMLGNRGPGSTSLARHLVIEFAGSDPMLAEEMIALHPNALLELPGTLAKISPRRRPSSALSSAGASVGQNADSLSDWLTSRSNSAAAAAAIERLDRRYWRACVRALLPWIEERRLPVIEKLRYSLEDYLYPTQGVWKKLNPWRSNEFIDIPINGLEFNDIVAMSHRQSADPFKPLDADASVALACCKQVKFVRDALAHMRPPSAIDIREMVRLLDELLLGPDDFSPPAVVQEP